MEWLYNVKFSKHNIHFRAKSLSLRLVFLIIYSLWSDFELLFFPSPLYLIDNFCWEKSVLPFSYLVGFRY